MFVLSRLFSNEQINTFLPGVIALMRMGCYNARSLLMLCLPYMHLLALSLVCYARKQHKALPPYDCMILYFLAFRTLCLNEPLFL
jgi:hypothetical protein